MFTTLYKHDGWSSLERIFIENEQIGPGYDLRRGENITYEGNAH
jgi:hypothetical protein